MPDREKVIHAIERCTCHVPDACRDCGYDAGHPYNECVELLLKDALELLKEQEAVTPIKARQGRNEYYSYFLCPVCKNDITFHQSYCEDCGRKMKWE